MDGSDDKKNDALDVKELLNYVAAAVLVVSLGGLLMFMTYVEIPPDNKDIITTINGVLVMGGSMALGRLLGNSDSEKKRAEELIAQSEKRVNQIVAKMDRLGAKYDVVKANYDDLIALLVDRHVIEGKGISEVVKRG